MNFCQVSIPREFFRKIGKWKGCADLCQELESPDLNELFKRDPRIHCHYEKEVSVYSVNDFEIETMSKETPVFCFDDGGRWEKQVKPTCRSVNCTVSLLLTCPGKPHLFYCQLIIQNSGEISQESLKVWSDWWVRDCLVVSVPLEVSQWGESCMTRQDSGWEAELRLTLQHDPLHTITPPPPHPRHHGRGSEILQDKVWGLRWVLWRNHFTSSRTGFNFTFTFQPRLSSTCTHLYCRINLGHCPGTGGLSQDDGSL